MTEKRKRVLLVAQIDGYANGVKPNAVASFLRARGHRVELVNTYYLSRLSAERGTFANKLPHPSPRRLGVYATEALSRFTRRDGFARGRLSYYLLLGDYRLRRSILADLLPLDEYDLVMCEHPQDAGLLTVPMKPRTFYDCPDPYADELYDEGKLTPEQRDRFKRLETELYRSVDGLSFSWESYARYARAHYDWDGRNLHQLNWGCNPSSERARFATPPRVVYLGSLSSQYINLPLLSRLHELYPHIDVYGGPTPDPSLRLNYRGWAPPTVLAGYQFGLITTSTDELRRDGFSAKHLDYIAYGLPVLVPEWRRHLDLLRGSLPYNEENFASVIDQHSGEREWQAASDEAYAQAERLTWDRTLQPLADFLEGS
jgi:hypothetical protein